MPRPALRTGTVFAGHQNDPAYTKEFVLEGDDDYFARMLRKLQVYENSRNDHKDEYFHRLKNEKQG